MVVWGTGTPRREFIFAQDLADACVFVMRNYGGVEPINLGGGIDLSIAELANAIAEEVGYGGRIRFDVTKPDGMPLKVLDSGPLRALGWRPSVDFRAGLAETYEWFLRKGDLSVRETIKRGDTADARATVPNALPDSPGGRGDRPSLPKR